MLSNNFEEIFSLTFIRRNCTYERNIFGIGRVLWFAGPQYSKLFSHAYNILPKFFCKKFSLPQKYAPALELNKLGYGKISKAKIRPCGYCTSDDKQIFRVSIK